MTAPEPSEEELQRLLDMSVNGQEAKRLLLPDIDAATWRHIAPLIPRTATGKGGPYRYAYRVADVLAFAAGQQAGAGDRR